MIYLSRNEIAFILNKVTLTYDLQQVLSANKGGCEISDDQADELRDCCIECLDEIGFDDNYELTLDGKKLDELVDKLFIG